MKNNDYIVSYAQNREDVIIEAFFKDKKAGFYVDVGANHPFYHSVTKRFYDKGWRGINIEPNDMLFKQIEEQRPEDTNLKVAIDIKAGKKKLRIYHSRDGLEGISTFSEEMKNDYNKSPTIDTENFNDVEVEIVPLSSIFEKHKVKTIDFIKIDVEGYEYNVIKSNDWSKFRPKLICIEANHIKDDWRPLLEEAKYSLVFNDGLNDYYLAEENYSLIKNFNYADVFLLSKPVLSYDIYEVIKSLEEQNKVLMKQVSSLSRKQNELEEIITDKQRQNEELGSRLDSITPLKKHIKSSIKSKFKK